MEAIKDLNQFLKKYKVSVGLGIVFLTCANFFLVWIPVLIRQTIDEVENLSGGGLQVPESLIQTLFVSEVGKILGLNSLILLGAVILYGFFLFLTRQTLIVSSRKVEYDMRNAIIEKLMQLPQRFYSKYSHGEV
ncbi:MAG: ABC transporter transmembrane domain-containing protein, partial [Balneolaceae bacterium]